MKPAIEDRFSVSCPASARAARLLIRLFSRRNARLLIRLISRRNARLLIRLISRRNARRVRRQGQRTATYV